MAETPRARTRIALRRRDVDELGHLNQSVYHELLEEGRVALLSSLAGGGPVPFVLVHVELDYRREVRLDTGSVEIDVRVERVGTTSVTLAHDVLLPDGAVAAEGRSVLVAWDPRARAARPLTDAERAALASGAESRDAAR